MPPQRRAPAFTPAEAAVLDVWHRLGEAARRSLHVSERVTARLVAMGHLRATVLGRLVRERRKD